ncbi:hypothetical protein TSAR_014314 [Trichomalopsis sarcophagae]|uniref:Uncharacterized protein n=1 Tax=Trichomalopsis sarcophagae TaxID=543379 RepID=A0A232FFJ1_9HYME|nr:hypothetical protein TSAR_014314 [Trichomalopsis sarcophagae]
MLSEFREQFDKIDQFFEAYSEVDMLDERITISDLTIRFMSYLDYWFEMLKDKKMTIREKSNESRPKRMRNLSLVFKRVDRLKALMKIIDYKILNVKEAIYCKRVG